jgi:hypothetical protein
METCYTVLLRVLPANVIADITDNSTSIAMRQMVTGDNVEQCLLRVSWAISMREMQKQIPAPKWVDVTAKPTN